MSHVYSFTFVVNFVSLNFCKVLFKCLRIKCIKSSYYTTTYHVKCIFQYSLLCHLFFLSRYSVCAFLHLYNKFFIGDRKSNFSQTRKNSILESPTWEKLRLTRFNTEHLSVHKYLHLSFDLFFFSSYLRYIVSFQNYKIYLDCNLLKLRKYSWQQYNGKLLLNNSRWINFLVIFCNDKDLFESKYRASN